MWEGAVVKTHRVFLNTNTHTKNTFWMLYIVILSHIVMHFLWFYSYLVALATRTAGLTSLEPIDVMPGEEGVGRALLALVSVFVDEVSSRTGDTRRAVLLTHHCTGVATRRWAIHRISHRDRVDLCDVIYIVTHLGETDSEWERFPCNKKVL